MTSTKLPNSFSSPMPMRFSSARPPPHLPPHLLPHRIIRNLDDLCGAIGPYPELRDMILLYHPGEPTLVHAFDTVLAEIKAIIDRVPTASYVNPPEPTLDSGHWMELCSLHLELVNIAINDYTVFAFKEMLDRFYHAFEYYSDPARLRYQDARRLMDLACEVRILPLLKAHPGLVHQLKEIYHPNTLFPYLHVVPPRDKPAVNKFDLSYDTTLETLGIYSISQLEGVGLLEEEAWWGLPWEVWTYDGPPPATTRVSFGELVHWKYPASTLELRFPVSAQREREALKDEKGHGEGWMT